MGLDDHYYSLIIRVNLRVSSEAGGCIACASEGHREPAGTWYVNTLLANVHKQNVTRFPYEIARLAQDMAGGYLTESMHGAGSPQAQRIMISRLVKMKEKQDTAKRLAGISGEGKE